MDIWPKTLIQLELEIIKCISIVQDAKRNIQAFRTRLATTKFIDGGIAFNEDDGEDVGDVRQNNELVRNETTMLNKDVLVNAIDVGVVDGLKCAMDQNKVSLLFVGSPKSQLFHVNGVMVCVDGSFSPTLNKKALSLGTNVVLNFAVLYTGEQNDVMESCTNNNLSGGDLTNYETIRPEQKPPDP